VYKEPLGGKDFPNGITPHDEARIISSQREANRLKNVRSCMGKMGVRSKQLVVELGEIAYYLHLLPFFSLTVLYDVGIY
jgi:hypothetical protein